MEHRKRKPLRLPEYDYGSNGVYFLTICTQDRRCLFWASKDPLLNARGAMVDNWIQKLPEKFPGVFLDCYVVMPNHVHLLLCLQEAQTDIQTIMEWFKTMTTNGYIRMVKESAAPPFSKRIWQRSYYDHVVRNEEDLREIRAYIQNNPIKWQQDRFYQD